MTRRALVVATLGFCGSGGCYTPPALPLIDEVPVEGPDFVPCASDIPEARVACVIDGMSFDQDRCLGEGLRLRLLAAAAPTGDACYAADAEAWLGDVVDGEEVYVSFDASCIDGDDGRLAYVWATGDVLEDLTGDPRLDEMVDEIGEDDEPAILLNQVALRLGYARYDPDAIPETPYFGPRMERAQTAAIADGLGLHAACAGED